MRFHRSLLRGASACALLLASPACSSAGDRILVGGDDTVTGPSATVMVTNSTCVTGPCQPLRVFAFPRAQFTTPGGLWKIELGTVTGASACLTIPGRMVATITGTGTTTYVWTSFQPVSLGIVQAGQTVFEAFPATTEFVPATRAGWTVTLPAGSLAAPAGACSL